MTSMWSTRRATLSIWACSHQNSSNLGRVSLPSVPLWAVSRKVSKSLYKSKLYNFKTTQSWPKTPQKPSTRGRSACASWEFLLTKITCHLWHSETSCTRSRLACPNHRWRACSASTANLHSSKMNEWLELGVWRQLYSGQFASITCFEAALYLKCHFTHYHCP